MACRHIFINSFTGKLFPQDIQLLEPPFTDKLIHIALFSGLAFLLAFGLRRQYPNLTTRCIFTWVAIISTFIAVLTELLQWYLPIKRDGNIYDGIADVAGVFIGFAAFFIVKNKIARK